MEQLTPAERRHLELLRDRGPWSRVRRGKLGSSWKRSYVGVNEPILVVLGLRGLVAVVERPGFAEFTLTDKGWEALRGAAK